MKVEIHTEPLFFSAHTLAGAIYPSVLPVPVPASANTTCGSPATSLGARTSSLSARPTLPLYLPLSALLLDTPGGRPSRPAPAQPTGPAGMAGPSASKAGEPTAA